MLLNLNNHSEAILWHIVACHVSLLHMTCSWPGSHTLSKLRFLSFPQLPFLVSLEPHGISVTTSLMLVFSFPGKRSGSMCIAALFYQIRLLSSARLDVGPYRPGLGVEGSGDMMVSPRGGSATEPSAGPSAPVIPLQNVPMGGKSRSHLGRRTGQVLPHTQT